MNSISIYESTLSVRGLTHRYGTKTAVDNISLEFAPSTIYGLLGSNGAGKSTTMNAMCGVLKPTSGDIIINGIALSKHPEEAKLQLGFLPQTPPLHPELTVTEYLRYTAGLRQIPYRKIRSAVEEVTESCMLNKYRHKLISSLSGGYQQRVGIAQSIIHRPKIVVLDEPTNGLDPNQTEIIRKLIREIAQDRTIILSTHILPEVQASCQHICMIESGKLVFDGSISAFENYIRPNSLLMTFANPPSMETFMTFSGITHVEHLNQQHQFRLLFEEDSNAIIDQIVAKSVEYGWLLREIAIEKNSPEKIFSAISKRTTS